MKKKDLQHNPKILFIDIELAPNLATVWGIWQQNIALNQLLETSYVLCWCAKWKGRRGVLFDSIMKSGKKGVIKSIWGLLNEADIVIHYNGKRFDVPTLNKEFLLFNMKPPSPYKQVDLYATVKSKFRFVSNKLAHVTKQLGYKGKISVDHQLWLDCMNKDKCAWEKMERYNKRDVTELEKIYNDLLPWITNHPNLGLFTSHERPACTNCGSDRVQSRGSSINNSRMYRRFQCQNCGTWLRGRYSILIDGRKNILTQVKD